jgi:hypothetical protein
LWQPAQLVDALKLLWSAAAAGVHAVVRWQVSHAAAVAMWPPGLPLAVRTLLQVLHVHGATRQGQKRAPP